MEQLNTIDFVVGEPMISRFLTRCAYTPGFRNTATICTIRLAQNPKLGTSSRSPYQVLSRPLSIPLYCEVNKQPGTPPCRSSQHIWSKSPCPVRASTAFRISAPAIRTNTRAHMLTRHQNNQVPAPQDLHQRPPLQPRHYIPDPRHRDPRTRPVLRPAAAIARNEARTPRAEQVLPPPDRLQRRGR